MTPTSALAGVLTGLADGGLVGLGIMLVAFVTRRRQQSSVPIHPVADDLPERRG